MRWQGKKWVKTHSSTDLMILEASYKWFAWYPVKEYTSNMWLWLEYVKVVEIDVLIKPTNFSCITVTYEAIKG